ncbi:stage III sporulation protein AF [Clostridium sp. WILCCON 0269]|uniref:Stage III sporulation protein AF n=1 Tax=Candidatus Clostridium eludens TaxID=3381663 RepID=A0ABW8SML4_9CLOT
MLESLREWLISICTAVFFITAIEMLLPDNSMKKYCKFVLGLILITIFINPIVKIFNRDFDINAYTAKAIENFDNNINSQKSAKEFNEYKQKSESDTIEAFESNLQASCEKSLKEKYPDGNYKVVVEADYDDESNLVYIKNVDVQAQKGSVEKVKKVDISGKTTAVGNFNTENSEEASRIKAYLSQQLNISEDAIHVNS